MKEFVLLFRMDILSPEAQPSAEQMKVYMVQWMEWIQWIEDKEQLAEGGNHLLPTGRVLHSGNQTTDRPYVAGKESVTGYVLVLAKNLEEATAIARRCPILQGEGTSVEIRETATPGH